MMMLSRPVRVRHPPPPPPPPPGGGATKFRIAICLVTQLAVSVAIAMLVGRAAEELPAHPANAPVGRLLGRIGRELHTVIRELRQLTEGLLPPVALRRNVLRHALGLPADHSRGDVNVRVLAVLTYLRSGGPLA